MNCSLSRSRGRYLKHFQVKLDQRTHQDACRQEPAHLKCGGGAESPCRGSRPSGLLQGSLSAAMVPQADSHSCMTPAQPPSGHACHSMRPAPGRPCLQYSHGSDENSSTHNARSMCGLLWGYPKCLSASNAICWGPGCFRRHLMCPREGCNIPGLQSA